MDTWSIRGLARELGTTAPRVSRALKKLRIEPRTVGGRAALTPEQASEVRRRLGVVPPAPGLTRSQTQVLAGLSRAPLGVRSARALAARAGISPTVAGRTISELVAQGLVTVSRERVVEGAVRDAQVIRTHYAGKRYASVAWHLARVALPSARQRRAPTRVPSRLLHLFWNTAPSQLDARRAGGYIARRLLTTGDLEGLAWAAEVLSPAHWRHGAQARGLPVRMRALALNLAASGEAP